MTRILLVCILAVTLGVFATGKASEAGPATTVTHVSAAQGFSGLGWVGKPMSPLVKEVGNRCRRDCDWCRKDCYVRFRVRCWGPNCRDNFTVCMRHCWDRICRWC